MLIDVWKKRFLPVFALVFFAMVCLQFSVPANVEAWMPGIPHPVQGEVRNSDGSTPADEDIIFRAYVIDGGDEVQTELEPSTNFYSSVDGYYGLDVGNFYTAWAEGDTVQLSVMNTANGECSRMLISLVYDDDLDEFPNYHMRDAIFCVPGDFAGMSGESDNKVDVWDFMDFTNHWQTNHDDPGWDQLYNINSNPDSQGRQSIDVWDFMDFTNHWQDTCN